MMGVKLFFWEDGRHKIWVLGGSFNFRLRTQNVPSGSRPKHLKRGRRRVTRKCYGVYWATNIFGNGFSSIASTNNGESCICLKLQIFAGNRKVPNLEVMIFNN